MRGPCAAFAMLHAYVAGRALILLLGLLIMAPGVPVFGASNGNGASELESEVKAAFLYKFLGYIDWPATAFPKPDSPYVIGVFSADAIAEELAGIAAGRSVNGRPVVVRKIKEGEPLSGVHMLFIGRSAGVRQAQLLDIARQNSIVSVTETENGLAQGSVINFHLADGRVRFEVSLTAAEKSDFKFSSRLLSVASSVVGPRR